VPVLQEDLLTFTFPHGWAAIKYDDTPFYRKHVATLAHSKAVDFVAYDALGGEVWLIEAKDYRAHRRTKKTSVIEETAAKVRDTIAGLQLAANSNTCAIHQFSQVAVQRPMRVALHLEQPQKPSKLFPIVIARQNATLKLRQCVRAVDTKAWVCEMQAMPVACQWIVA
jgi:hypothetical protein